MRIMLILMGSSAIGAALLFPGFWLFALVGLIPLIVMTGRSQPLRACGYGLLHGLIVVGCATYAGTWHALPLEWIGVPLSRATQYLLVGGGWASITIVGALPYAAWAYVYNRLHSDSYRDVLVAPSLFVLAETASALSISVVIYSSHTIFGPHVSTGFIGTILADDTAISQVAWLGGVFALSFAAVAANIVFIRLFSALGPERKYYRVLVLGATAIWAGGSIALSSPPATGMLVSAVSTRLLEPLTSAREEAFHDHVWDLVTHASTSAIIVVPEGTQLLSGERATPEALSQLADGRTRVIVDSDVTDSGMRRMQFLTLPDFNRTSSYKQLLVPLGEYAPYAYTVFRLIADNDATAVISARRNYQKGTASPAVTPLGVIAGRFCEEILSPLLYRSDATRGAQLFVNAGSQIWYHESRPLHLQTVRAGKLRAIENHRYLIVANDTSPSFALDWHGRLLGESPQGTEGVLTVPVRLSDHMTPYTSFGAWWLLVPSGIVLADLLRRRRTGRAVQ